MKLLEMLPVVIAMFAVRAPKGQKSLMSEVADQRKKLTNYKLQEFVENNYPISSDNVEDKSIQAQYLTELYLSCFNSPFGWLRIFRLIKYAKKINDLEVYSQFLELVSDRLQSLNPFVNGVIALSLTREASSFSQVAFGIHLLILATNVDEFGSESLKEFVYIERLAKPVTHLILIHKQEAWGIIHEALEADISWSHRASIGNQVLEYAITKKQDSLLDDFIEWLLSTPMQMGLIHKSNAKRIFDFIVAKKNDYLNSDNMNFWNALTDCFYYLLEDQELDFFGHVDSQLFVDAYLKIASKPDLLDTPEHILTLSLLKKKFDQLKKQLLVHKEIIDIRASNASSIEVASWLRAGWTRGNCEKYYHSCSELLSHPKWRYIVYSNLERGVDLQANIVFADSLGIDIYNYLMKLVEIYPDSLLIWEKLFNYEDPWMQTSVLSTLELKISMDPERIMPIAKELLEYTSEKNEPRALRCSRLLRKILKYY